MLLGIGDGLEMVFIFGLDDGLATGKSSTRMVEEDAICIRAEIEATVTASIFGGMFDRIDLSTAFSLGVTSAM